MSDEKNIVEFWFLSIEEGSIARLAERARYQFDVLRSSPLGAIGLLMLAVIVVTAILAPYVAPYDPHLADYTNKFQPPSTEHWLGTDNAGRDIFSQLLYGARPALLIGFVTATAIASLGTIIGVLAGYYGGLVDDLLMRLVDFAYGIPTLPFLLILVALWKPSIYIVVFGLAVLLWRSTARVIRSHVLTLKEKPFIKSARAAGASDSRIILRHLVPNVLPLTFLYGSFAIAWAILGEANLSFLGFGDPEMFTWGKMLLFAYTSQALARSAWWWFASPGFAIMITVISAFAIGRGYEEIINPELRER